MKNKGTRWLTALLAAALLLTAVPCAYAQGAPALQEMEITAKRLKVRHHPGVDDVPEPIEVENDPADVAGNQLDVGAAEVVVMRG